MGLTLAGTFLAAVVLNVGFRNTIDPAGKKESEAGSECSSLEFLFGLLTGPPDQENPQLRIPFPSIYDWDWSEVEIILTAGKTGALVGLSLRFVQLATTWFKRDDTPCPRSTPGWRQLELRKSSGS